MPAPCLRSPTVAVGIKQAGFHLVTKIWGGSADIPVGIYSVQVPWDVLFLF